MIFTIQIPDPVIILGNHPLQKTSWGNLCQHEHPNSPNNTFHPQNLPKKRKNVHFELTELFKKSKFPPCLFLWEKKTNSRKTQGFVWVQPCGCFQKYEKTPKSSILIGFSIINHPFWGFSPYLWFNIHMVFRFFPPTPNLSYPSSS